MTDFTSKKAENVTRYLGRRFRPFACAAMGATAIGVAGIAVPVAAQAQNELNAEEVQLVLQKNRELLDTIDALTKKLGITPGDNPWADFQQQIQSLQSELGNVRSQLGQAETRMSENAALVDNLRSQHAERVEQLQKQLLEASNIIDETKNQAAEDSAAALAQASQMSEQLEQLQSNLAARENRLAGLKSQLLKTISSKNTEQVALQQQHDVLHQRLDETIVSLDSTTADYQDQQTVIENLRAELGNANIDLKKASADLAEAARSDKMQDFELMESARMVSALRSTLKKREAIVRKQDLGISRLTQANAELAGGLVASEDEAMQAQAALEVATADIANFQQSETILQQQAANRAEVIKRQDRGINRLLARLSAIGDDLRETSAVASQRESELMAEIARHQQSIEAGKGQQRHLRMENRDLLAAYRESDDMSVRQDLKLRQMSSDLEAEREQQSVLAAHLEETQSIADAAKARNREFKQQLADVESNLEKSGSENARLAEMLAQAADENTAVSKQLQAANEQGADLEASLAQSQTDLANLESSLVQSESNIAQLEAQLADLQSSLAGLESELAQTQSGLAQSESSIAQLQAELADSQSDFMQTRSELQAALEQEKTLTGFLDETRQVADGQREKIAALQQEISTNQDALASVNAEKTELMVFNASMQNNLAELDNTLGKRAVQISELESSVGQLEDNNGALESQLASGLEKNESLQSDLSGLRDKVAAPRKAALALRDLVGESLKEQGINDTVLVIRPDNSVTFKIPNELLFVSGSARLNRNGRTMLAQVGEALSKADESINIRVEGHTDSVPVAEKFRHIFPSNWYLSVARAANAVDFLHNQAALDPARLSATGFGEFSPLGSNETEEGRNRNRRVEIVLIPGADAGQAGS